MSSAARKGVVTLTTIAVMMAGFLIIGAGIGYAAGQKDAFTQACEVDDNHRYVDGECLEVVK